MLESRNCRSLRFLLFSFAVFPLATLPEPAWILKKTLHPVK
jgi:hypothetical protein